MENEFKPCYNCMFYHRLYTKGTKKFNKTKFAWCFKHQKIVETQDTCNGFVFFSRKKSIGPIKIKLCEILTELCTIRQFVEEDSDETNQDV